MTDDRTDVTQPTMGMVVDLLIVGRRFEHALEHLQEELERLNFRVERVRARRRREGDFTGLCSAGPASTRSYRDLKG